MTIGWAQVVVIALILGKATTSFANDIYINQVGDDLTMTVV